MKQTAQIVSVSESLSLAHVEAVVNSSIALFWLKQVCYNKGAGGDEERDRFVYAGGKVQQARVPRLLVQKFPVCAGRVLLSSLVPVGFELCLWKKNYHHPQVFSVSLFCYLPYLTLC